MSNGSIVEIVEGCRIGVDTWTKNGPTLQACFLTHAHSDHTKGLSERWTGNSIHCSQQTREFIIARWPQLEDRTTTVTVDKPFDMRLMQADKSEFALKVTPIDACHCPGSVMFLFESVYGRILHTGDFRWELEDGRMVLPEVLQTCGPIDRLYMDNTYCNPKHRFPCRSVVMKTIVSTVELNPEFQFVIGLDNLGKEELVEAVSNAANEPVGVNQQRARTLEIARIPQKCYTTETSTSKISILPKWKVKQDDLASTIPPSIGIVPSSLFGAAHHNPKKVPIDSWTKQQLRVCFPYSLHSSFNELEAFVRALKPRDVIGIVKESRGLDIDPSHHFAHLLACGDEGERASDEISGGFALELAALSFKEQEDRQCEVSSRPGEIPSQIETPISVVAKPNLIDGRKSCPGKTVLISKRSWRKKLTNSNRKLAMIRANQDNHVDESETAAVQYPNPRTLVFSSPGAQNTPQAEAATC